MKIIALIGLAVILMLVTFLSTNCGISMSIKWETAQVLLEADMFYIVANGGNYYAHVKDIDIHSDSGSEDYCTLELVWHENGVEMRLNINFYSNNTHWWSAEIRTYDGQKHGDWIYYKGDYKGEFFKTSLGVAFTGDIDLQSDDDNEYAGEIHFKNLNLQLSLTGSTTEVNRHLELMDVIHAVSDLKKNNNLTSIPRSIPKIPTIPNPVASDTATNNMAAFPDMTSDDDTNGGKLTDPDGNAYTIATGNDLPGYVLFGNDETGDNSASPVVNYYSKATTTYYYTVDEHGSVHQFADAAKTGGEL